MYLDVTFLLVIVLDYETMTLSSFVITFKMVGAMKMFLESIFKNVNPEKAFKVQMFPTKRTNFMCFLKESLQVLLELENIFAKKCFIILKTLTNERVMYKIQLS